MTQQNIVGIQYLRAIAAVLVVAAHASNVLPAVGPWAHNGVAGVDVFFVVSGFIMAHTTRAFDQSARVSEASTFVRRRLLRIVPLYWIASLWTIKVPLVHGQFSADYAKDFLFVPRVHSSGQTWPELVAGWTLNYEMFFYAGFALAMLAGRMRYWILGALLAGLVAAGLVFHPTGTATAFYTTPIVLEFLFGVIVYRLGPQIKAPRPVAIAAMVGGFALLLLGNGSLNRVISDGIPAVVIVWAAAQLSSGAREVRWLRFLGDASYSIYLFHLAAYSLIEKVMRGVSIEALPLPIAFVVICAAATAVGVIMHVVLEKPLLRLLERRKAKPLPAPA